MVGHKKHYSIGKAWRFAKAHYSSVVKQTKKAAKHGLKAGILAPEPEMVEVV